MTWIILPFDFPFVVSVQSVQTGWVEFVVCVRCARLLYDIILMLTYHKDPLRPFRLTNVRVLLMYDFIVLLRRKFNWSPIRGFYFPQMSSNSHYSFIILSFQRYVVTTDRSGEIHVTVQVSAIQEKQIWFT